MAHPVFVTSPKDVLRARGRTIAVFIFAAFGGAWLLAALGVFHLFQVVPIAIIGVTVCVFFALAMRLLRRLRYTSVQPLPPPTPERLRDNRLFNILNAAQWIAIFIAAQLLSYFGHSDLITPAVAAIVGIHFFLMPRSYRSFANLVVGAAMLVASLLGAALLHGDRMIGAVTLASGIILWVAAANSLRAASRLIAPGDISRPAVPALKQ